MLVWADRKWRLGHGKVFALYVVLYTAGRFWIEALRIDTVNEIGGFRLNNYTSLIVFVVALVWLVWLIRNRPGRESVVEGPGAGGRRTSRQRPSPRRLAAADVDQTTLSRRWTVQRPPRETPSHVTDLTGRTALVTGGNGGLGLEMCRGLARAGARVLVNGRDPERTRAAAAGLQADGLLPSRRSSTWPSRPRSCWRRTAGSTSWSTTWASGTAGGRSTCRSTTSAGWSRST